MNWHSMSVRETVRAVAGSSVNGLDNKEVQKRLKENGENRLAEKKQKSVILRFLGQFNDFMVIILIVAAVISFWVEIYRGGNDFVDPVMIMAIVILNAIIGLVQENKAERALDALKNLSSPHARVIRDGKCIDIETSKLVVGDLIRLQQGDYVPADCRLVEAVNLKVTEANLTGESLPIDKEDGAVLKEDTLLGDRRNMLFMGTSITMGRATAMVVATGMATEMGKIAGMIMQEETQSTPLQKKLAETGKLLGIGALGICMGIFLIGVIRQIPVFEMFMTSVSLAVAAIPEGLPAIVTIMLAIGVQRMAERKAVVKRLPAVETLGSATVICSDKTGTLTQNNMKVTEVYGENIKEVLRYGGLCNDAVLEDGNKVSGEPTESAIVKGGLSYGVDKNECENEMPRVGEIPFESQRKLMSTVHRHNGEYVVITKGAPEILLKKCRYYKEGGVKRGLTEIKAGELKSENDRMAAKALRVLGVAYKELSVMPEKVNEDNIESDLIFLGLIGIIDPPREEVAGAVATCKRAGIKPVMITGDNVITAKAIGQQIGIMERGDKCLTGEELNRISQEELVQNIYEYSIFARVSPEHKVRIVKAYKERGAVVAMTGDGVNDAPALKAADIGCAMGISGTDVAKEAADMVLTDDNFATIVEAVKEGRGIYANIKKAVHFLLSSNIGEILTIFAAMIIGFITPLVAVQLLWVNLVTDSLPAIALGLDPCEEGIMEKPPVKGGKGMFTKELWARIGLEGAMIGMLALLGFGIGSVLMGDITVGRTMAFATLSISQLVHAFNMRSDGSIFEIKILDNAYLVGALAIGTALQVGVIQIGILSKIFKVTPMSASCWLVVLVLCIMPIVIVELEKKFSKEK